jgi:hypothetical protein
VTIFAVEVHPYRQSSKTTTEVISYNGFRYLVWRGVGMKEVSMNFVNSKHKLLFMTLSSSPFKNKHRTTFQIDNRKLYSKDEILNGTQQTAPLHDIYMHHKRHCQSLTTLILPEYETKLNITEDCVMSILKSSPNFTELHNNSFNSNITNSTMECLSQYCPQFEVLDMSDWTFSHGD